LLLIIDRLEIVMLVLISLGVRVDGGGDGDGNPELAMVDATTY
jgi:hypothetical protein